MFQRKGKCFGHSISHFSSSMQGWRHLLLRAPGKLLHWLNACCQAIMYRIFIFFSVPTSLKMKLFIICWNINLGGSQPMQKRCLCKKAVHKMSAIRPQLVGLFFQFALLLLLLHTAFCWASLCSCWKARVLQTPMSFGRRTIKGRLKLILWISTEKERDLLSHLTAVLLLLTSQTLFFYPFSPLTIQYPWVSSTSFKVTI